jgi:glucose uptake protein GlcU
VLRHPLFGGCYHMKVSHLIGLSILAIGILLMKESRKSKVKRQTFNGISFNPTAVFIFQSRPHHGVSKHFKHDREE